MSGEESKVLVKPGELNLNLFTFVYGVRVPIRTPRSIFKDHKERVSVRIGSTPLDSKYFQSLSLSTDKRKTERKSREVVFGLCQLARAHRQQKRAFLLKNGH